MNNNNNILINALANNVSRLLNDKLSPKEIISLLLSNPNTILTIRGLEVLDELIAEDGK